jgi:hypothetical protein
VITKPRSTKARAQADALRATFVLRVLHSLRDFRVAIISFDRAGHAKAPHLGTGSVRALSDGDLQPDSTEQISIFIDREGPLPVVDLRLINTFPTGTVAVFDDLVPHPLLDMSACDLELENPVDRVDLVIDAIDRVAHREVQRRVDIAVFLVATHVQVLVVGAGEYL